MQCFNNSVVRSRFGKIKVNIYVSKFVVASNKIYINNFVLIFTINKIILGGSIQKWLFQSKNFDSNLNFMGTHCNYYFIIA